MSKNNPQKQSDEKLMELFIQNRNPQIFAEIYRRYFQNLSKYISWLTQDRETGKDIAQNILIKIFHDPQLFDYSRNFKVWLITIAKNRWKNEVRKEAIKTKHFRMIARMGSETVLDQEFKPEKKRASQVQEAMAKLSESHREVIVLKYSENLSIKEMSQILDCSEGTIKSRLYYALSHLRTLLNVKA